MQEQTGLSNLQRLAIVVGAIVVLVVAYVVISGGSDDPKTDATQPAATQPAATQSTDTQCDRHERDRPPRRSPPLRRRRRPSASSNAKPQGGVKKLNFNKGDTIRFRVVSDTADEIHVHGYDLTRTWPRAAR